MEYSQYQQHVLARASTAFHGDKLPARTTHDILKTFIDIGNELDKVKKTLMYGRTYDGTLKDEYHSDGDVTMEQLVGELDEREQGIIHAILGHATEGVELVEALFKRLFASEPFDNINLQEEFGDGEWYRALGLHHVGQTHEENLVQNDAKLATRYGPVEEGFKYKGANERDLDAERRCLEGRIQPPDALGNAVEDDAGHEA